LNNQIFASSFDNLNDPFEGTYKEEISLFVNSIQQLFRVDTAQVIKSLEAIKDFHSRLGIYSLSLTFSNELMWSHYAGSHAGFCIEYEVEKLKGGALINDSVIEIEVNYQDEVPLITYKDIGSETLLKKMFATKSVRWNYEKEIRLIYDTCSLKSYHSSALTGIYFGIKAPDDIKQKLIDSLTNRDVKFYQLFKASNSYHLERKLIHENQRLIRNKLNDAHYEILKTKHNRLMENFYVLYKNSDLDESTLKAFFIGFREKFATKDCNINLFDDKSILQIIDKYPLSKDEYIKYADHLIALSPNDSPDCIVWYPYQDFQYREFGGKNSKRETSP
jgi:hypothetical protein